MLKIHSLRFEHWLTKNDSVLAGVGARRTICSARRRTRILASTAMK
jgi:hypothetical protein